MKAISVVILTMIMVMGSSCGKLKENQFIPTEGEAKGISSIQSCELSYPPSKTYSASDFSESCDNEKLAGHWRLTYLTCQNSLVDICGQKIFGARMDINESLGITQSWVHESQCSFSKGMRGTTNDSLGTISLLAQSHTCSDNSECSTYCENAILAQRTGVCAQNTSGNQLYLQIESHEICNGESAELVFSKEYLPQTNDVNNTGESE